MNGRRPPLPLVVVNANKLCQNPLFQQFANVNTPAAAKAFMCEQCQIKSKKELVTNLPAFKRFSGLIERFNKWLSTKNI